MSKEVLTEELALDGLGGGGGGGLPGVDGGSLLGDALDCMRGGIAGIGLIFVGEEMSLLGDLA